MRVAYVPERHSHSEVVIVGYWLDLAFSICGLLSYAAQYLIILPTFSLLPTALVTMSPFFKFVVIYVYFVIVCTYVQTAGTLLTKILMPP